MVKRLTDPDNQDLKVRIRECDAGSGNVCITEEEEKHFLLKVTSMKLFEEHRFSFSDGLGVDFDETKAIGRN